MEPIDGGGPMPWDKPRGLSPADRLEAALQATLISLPPGFAFEKDGGVWMLTSPSGDATAISSKPIPTERESADAAAIAKHLNDNIDYSRHLAGETGSAAQRDDAHQCLTVVRAEAAQGGRTTTSTAARSPRGMLAGAAILAVAAVYPSATFRPLPVSDATDRLAAYCVGEIERDSQSWAGGCDDPDPKVKSQCRDISDAIRADLDSDLAIYRNYLRRRDVLREPNRTPAAISLASVERAGGQDADRCAAQADLCDCPERERADACWGRCDEALLACKMVSQSTFPERMPEGSIDLAAPGNGTSR